ncbi:MFS transporter [Serratia ureilytica]|uniref:MFS transporter n=1 Tax=Serratia ureilytica TaxID=300181 RepID=UPI0034C6A91C
MERLRRLSLRINPIFAAFLLIAFLSGIAGALLTPTLSLFLTTEVKVRPLWVGLFYTANAVAGIVVSFLLAKRSDTRGDRRRLILLCCLMAVGNCLLFAFNRDYLTLITAGVLMGTAAGLEIPAMLLAGYYVKRFGKRNMMLLAVAAGVLFYLGLTVLATKPTLIALQLLNAVFIGIVAGIGMLYFQDLMPGRPGAATTLFTNSISTGVILAGVLQGALVENLGHGSVYWMAALLALAALWMSAKVREV